MLFRSIDIEPLTVNFQEESFQPGINLTTEEFYERLQNCGKELPTTSQVNPYNFEQLFRSYLDQGDEIIVITISHKLSGTYQSAVIAKETLESDDIYLIDSTSGSVGEYLLADIAVKMRDNGASAKEIQDKLLELIPRVRVYAQRITACFSDNGHSFCADE